MTEDGDRIQCPVCGTRAVVQKGSKPWEAGWEYINCPHCGCLSRCTECGGEMEQVDDASGSVYNPAVTRECTRCGHSYTETRRGRVARR